MQKLIGCFLLALCSFLVVNGARQATPMRTFTVDLNDPPETRWNHVLEPYLSSMPLAVEYFDSLVRF